jgi:hypothetical protein
VVGIISLYVSDRVSVCLPSVSALFFVVRCCLSSLSALFLCTVILSLCCYRSVLRISVLSTVSAVGRSSDGLPDGMLESGESSNTCLAACPMTSSYRSVHRPTLDCQLVWRLAQSLSLLVSLGTSSNTCPEACLTGCSYRTANRPTLVRWLVRRLTQRLARVTRRIVQRLPGHLPDGFLKSLAESSNAYPAACSMAFS